MKKSVKRVVFWMPRILCILFAVVVFWSESIAADIFADISSLCQFVNIFALDVFGESVGDTVFALLMHLVPTAIILIALAIAWCWEGVGAILFAALGVWYVIVAWGRFEWTTYLLVAGPLFFISALFLVNWSFRASLRSST